MVVRQHLILSSLVGQKGDLALLSTQEMLAVDAPRRHKVSVHVLAREMDSCKY